MDSREEKVMKKASRFEKIAARCWNLLNEGKPFTPIFVTGVMVIFHWKDLFQSAEMLTGFLLALPLFVIYYLYDFPLFLRNYLWIPLFSFLIIWGYTNVSLLLLGMALYFFFTVFFWGTLYYHLRIGTSWLNFTRFWKLVLKNSDSTSGNAQEQLPKIFLLLSVWDYGYEVTAQGEPLSFVGFIFFYVAILLYAWVLHHYLFDWKPTPYTSFTEKPTAIEQPSVQTEKVVVIVVDGMRKDRFEAAHTPFLDRLKQEGTEFTNMETVYPARTVVCFSSMFTGTYPFEHGIRSNMVWKLGIKVESIFDSLRKVGKKGRLLGIAHLVDAMGEDVETVTAVMHNDVADKNIMNRARQIVTEQNPDLLVVQLIGTDQTGHSRGVFYDEYLQKISEADELIHDFYHWLNERWGEENITYIICADHGQADGIGGHGHLDEGERYVPFIMYGPSIRKGVKVDKKHSLVSLASTISYLLGAPFPSHARGPVLVEAFKRKDAANEEANRNRIFTSL
jgi:hypothetical protein